MHNIGANPCQQEKFFENSALLCFFKKQCVFGSGNKKKINFIISVTGRNRENRNLAFGRASTLDSMKKICFAFVLLMAFRGVAQNDSVRVVKPVLYPGWTLYVPGATHFYDGRIGKGLIFSGAEIGGITLGMMYDQKLRSGSSSPYYNFPLLLGLQAYNVDKCDWARNRLEAMKYFHHDFRYDPVSFNELLKAPFLKENFFTPVTGYFIVLAIAELFLGKRPANPGIRSVDQFYFINRYIGRDPALAIYGATSLAASYGAGVAEKYWFRNGLMPVMDYKYGQKKGLIYSSLLFGSNHFVNLFFADKPDFGSTLLQVAEASMLGYFLGRDVQRRGYKIGPAVSAHMWYDFTLMLGSFLMDPQNNFLGVNVRFKIEGLGR